MSANSAEHLEEILHDRHESEFNRKKTLDDKSNNVMTVGGTIASIYSGFGIIVVTEFFKTVFQLNVPAIILLGGIIALVFSIILAAKAFLLRDYDYPFNYKQFIDCIDQDYKISYNNNKIDEFIKRDPGDFNKLMIKIYTKCISKNSSENNSKAKTVLWSQIIFLIGLSSFPFFIIALVL